MQPPHPSSQGCRGTGDSSTSHCRRKSKQALRDYKKVQIQLENLETSVRDRCKKEFTGKGPGILQLQAKGLCGCSCPRWPLMLQSWFLLCGPCATVSTMDFP